MKRKIVAGIVILLLGFLLGGLPFYALGKFTGQGRYIPSPTIPNVSRQIMESGRAFSDIVNTVSPSVVNISTTKVVRKDAGPFFDDPFFDFFSPFHDFGAPKKWKERSLGSGVIVSADGYIVTNNHVVEKAEEIKVTLFDKRVLKGRIVGVLVRFKWSEALGGDAKYIKIANLIVKELLLSTEYTLTDVVGWLKHKSHSIHLTFEECNQDIDLYKEGTDFKIPVFFLLGKWDLLTVPSGAVALMEVITAPKKKIFWFDTGHEIHWERPEEYQRELVKCFDAL